MERFSDWLKANSYVDVNIDKWVPLDEALKQLKTSEEALENTINNLNSDASIKEDDCFWVDDYGGKWVSRLVVASLQGWEDAVNQAELGEKFTESLVIKKLTEKIAALTEENAYLEKKESSIKDNSAELESFKSKYNKDIASRDSKIESLQESLDEVKSNAEKLAEEYASFKEEAEKDKQQALSKQGGKYANKVATLEADLAEASKKKEKAEADLGILTASLRKKDEELALHKSAGSKLPELVDSLKAVRAQLEEERKILSIWKRRILFWIKSIMRRLRRSPSCKKPTSLTKRELILFEPSSPRVLKTLRSTRILSSPWLCVTRD